MTEDRAGPKATGPRLRFATLDAENWADLQQLFEARGGPHYCWCMAWRWMPSKDRKDKAAKKAALKERVAEGVPIGILGYIADRPVAWCSVGPRSSFRRLAGGDIGAADEAVWSIVCFFVSRPHRQQGLTGQLIRYAIDYARSRGADAIEAYPVERSSTSYRFMGYTDRFEQAGFTCTGKAGKHRKVMRLQLR